jgi:nicotinamidase-related amidase
MKCILLIIDVQRGLFDHEPRPYEADAVVDRINILADRARHAGTPVVFVQHETETTNWRLAQTTGNWSSG